MKRAFPSQTPSHAAVAAALILVALALGSCGAGDSPQAPDVSFTVDPAQLGEVYENADLRFAYRPPVGWEKLEGAQRQAVLDALATAGTEGDAFTVAVQDIFFSTESLSFSSVAAVGDPSGASLTRESYAEAFGTEIGLPAQEGSESEIVARADFAVNDVVITQFRHLRDERVTFTLLLDGHAGKVIQIDYSIPTSVYQKESVKLESSIGTIRSVAAE